MKEAIILQRVLTLLLFFGIAMKGRAQAPSRVRNLFPEKATVYGNIPYAGDTLEKHQLDIYLPEGARSKTPLVVWIHGGAWMLNDKYADMIPLSIMPATLSLFCWVPYR